MQGGCRHAPALQRRLASGGQPAPLAAAHGGGDRAIEPGPAVAAAFAPTGIFTQGAESLAARNGPRHASTRPRAMEATAAAAPDASGACDGALGYSATADEPCLGLCWAASRCPRLLQTTRHQRAYRIGWRNGQSHNHGSCYFERVKGRTCNFARTAAVQFGAVCIIFMNTYVHRAWSLHSNV